MPGNRSLGYWAPLPAPGWLSLNSIGARKCIWFNFHLFKFPNTNFMTYKVFYLRRICLLVSIGKGLNVGSVNELTVLFPCPDRLSATWSTTMERRGVREKHWNLQTTCGSGALESETVMRSCNPGSLHWDAERSVPRHSYGPANAAKAAVSRRSCLKQARRWKPTPQVDLWPPCLPTHTNTHTHRNVRAGTHACTHAHEEL